MYIIGFNLLVYIYEEIQNKIYLLKYILIFYIKTHLIPFFSYFELIDF